MSGENANDLDAKHKANSAQIVSQMVSNNAKVAVVPNNVGRSEPAMNVKHMQGTANGVQPDAFMNNRS